MRTDWEISLTRLPQIGYRVFVGLSVRNDHFLTPSELLFHAEQFCLRVHEWADDLSDQQERQDILLKIGQSRSLLLQLERTFEEGKLQIGRPPAAQLLHCLIAHLQWCAFYCRKVIDRRTFRRLSMIQAGFSDLLISELVRGAMFAEKSDACDHTIPIHRPTSIIHRCG